MESASERQLDVTLPFRRVRERSEHLCAHLAPDDCHLQAVAETSPLKWHLAHTTWFFETFVLKPFLADYTPFHPGFESLFNSYYNGIGEQHPRPRRHLLSRPTLETVYAYRHSVDQAIAALLSKPPAEHRSTINQRITLGLHHEQQHQELMLTDIKYNLYCNPLLPIYREATLAAGELHPLGFVTFDGGLVDIGHPPDDTFAYDNESPRHKTWLEPFAFADRLITNGEFQAFIADGGYQRPELWLADGWSAVQEQQWRHPLYWLERDGDTLIYTLHGIKTLDAHWPVTHLSFYEADAFARWFGARLPSEAEWEHVANRQPINGQLYHDQSLHPLAPDRSSADAVISDLFGSAWEWTASSYHPYPGYAPDPGALGEYNGKFMCNQFVLRGGSCVTPADHIRSTYRNFFYPADRWQFTGLRLAKG
jgi:ergothioneine biosynthesis protein EgtB